MIKFEISACGIIMLALGLAVTHTMAWACGYTDGKEYDEISATVKEAEEERDYYLWKIHQLS